MKKLTAILMMILLLIPCAYAEADADALTDMTGVWADAWSQRAMLEIERDGTQYVARVHWANSAFEFVQWEMRGEFINGVLETENCVKTTHSYAEDGSEKIEILYENEKAALAYSNGIIAWTDIEGMGSECRFEKLEGAQKAQTAIDMSEILTEEQLLYLSRLASVIPEFFSEQDMDQQFWENFLFYYYTDAFEQEPVMVSVDELGFEDFFVAVSDEEADQLTEEVFGVRLSDMLPREVLTDGLFGGDWTRLFWKDGVYYIGVSDSPEYEQRLESASPEDMEVAFVQSLYGEDQMRMHLFLKPANNEHGFVISSKYDVPLPADSLGQEDAPGYQPLQTEDLYGTWEVYDYDYRGIGALSLAECDERLLTRLEYSKDGFQTSGLSEIWTAVTGYKTTLVTAREMEEMFAGFSGEVTTGYTLHEAVDAEGDLFGQFFYQIDEETGLICYEGVFFRVSRISE